MQKRLIKNILLFLALFSVLTLNACGKESQKTKKPTQEELFLTAVSEGLRARSAEDRDITNMSFEEIKTFYRQLVGYDLDRISDYETVTFSDEQFNKLAHDYISGCKQQLRATDCDNELQMYSEWNAGLSARIDAVTALHNSYGLVVPQEILDNFNEFKSYSIEDFARELNAAYKETPEEGLEIAVEVGPDGTLIFKMWADGFSSDAYWASQGSEESVSAYTDALKMIIDEFAQLQDDVNQRLVAVGLPKTEIELQLMNDVNRNNTISVIKKGTVVYDSALGIDMLGIGTNMNK